MQVIVTALNDGSYDISDRMQLDLSEYISKHAGKQIEITYKAIGVNAGRSKKQNNALHKYFELLAIELNESGLDMKKVLKPTVDIPWGKETIKEFLWKPIMEAQTRKKSTTELTSKQIDAVFDTVNRLLSEKFGVHIPFPSIEEAITWE
jgi:hypothetical protein